MRMQICKTCHNLSWLLLGRWFCIAYNLCKYIHVGAYSFEKTASPCRVLIFKTVASCAWSFHLYALFNLYETSMQSCFSPRLAVSSLTLFRHSITPYFTLLFCQKTVTLDYIISGKIIQEQESTCDRNTTTVSYMIY